MNRYARAVLRTVRGSGFIKRQLVRSAIANAGITAICLTARRTVIAGRDDFIVFHDHRAIVFSQAGRSRGNGRGNVQIVFIFADSFQMSHLRFSSSSQGRSPRRKGKILFAGGAERAVTASLAEIKHEVRSHDRQYD